MPLHPSGFRLGLVALCTSLCVCFLNVGDLADKVGPFLPELASKEDMAVATRWSVSPSQPACWKWEKAERWKCSRMFWVDSKDMVLLLECIAQWF
mmetsp:Transcript_77337/g.208748  ORF Transcript_77337/g.208748 Transcript_77337/m.208748 type:complete len:95 (+) Transcript_77337:314-598(+)